VSDLTIEHQEDLHEDNFATARSIPIENTREDCAVAQPHGPSNAEQEMWDTFVPTDGAFEIERGPEEVLDDARKEFECKIKEFGLWGGLETMPEEDIGHLEDAWDEAEHDDILTEILQNLGQSESYILELNLHEIPLALENDESEGIDDDPSNQDSNAWHPYSSKLMFLLDTIDNLPRLRISESLMKVLLWLLQKVGVKHVPSFDTLRKIQRKVRDETGIPTINWMSPKGNAFSFNDPRAIIANVRFFLVKQHTNLPIGVQ
jgi:hypothetical protein